MSELPPEPDRLLTEVEEVYATRYVRLLALRIEPTDALQLINRPDIAHEAEALYARGCSPELIVQILT